MSSSKPAEGQPLVGDVIAGKYRIESVAGEGGMGIVYEAVHVILRQRVAVKALLPGSLSSTEALDRFSHEASAIARIACEHVVRVMDAGTLPSGAPYLVMEYLEGSDLETLLARRGPLDSTEVVDFALQALQALEALAHAHAAHVIHRDLKCANLFLARAPDGRSIIKLLDFGLAMSNDLDVDDDRVLGSPRYMSPEQLENRPLDPRTDLWSLGVVIYELLSGDPPFDGRLGELITGILQEPHIPLSARRPAISPALSRIVGRCLEKRPEDRWETAAELAHALAPHGSGAWKDAVPRIERALAKPAPPRVERRYATLDAALQALDARSESARAPVSSPATLGATIPAPRSSEAPAVEIVPEAKKPDVATTRKSAQAPVAARVAVSSFSERAPLSSTLRILMIDDSDFVLGVHTEVLAEAGFDVRSTTSASEFDGLLETWKPHLVLMDVQMPGMSGDELCRRVKAKFKATVPVVFVSNLPTPELAERASRGGADAFVSKSGDWAAFVAFVRNVCAITYSPEHLP